ncbi:uncharacterized protein LOC114131588 isoform X1 [Aphis gossypii]|uniref:PHD-type domain-containing protein n=1 Tax=Aphis gossypii TaxID=80765 RepID=A0A9P0J2T2_APHGO|nr:uncharacterized protein LOC114131588 isoform X1 [Aphis gossypii]CAH1725105.1 unnamed protein product [Aphis gossypii]
MPKKKVISRDEPVPARPHRNMKAKVVFDPSDNHIPKKRAKYSYKNEKSAEASTVKRTSINDRRRKQDTSKSKSLPVNPVTEPLDCSSVDTSVISPVHSPIKSPVISATSEVTQELSKMCYLCSKVSENKELLDCQICLIKAHKDCIIVGEPVWKFKLDLSPWFCKPCRKENCGKCLKEKSQVMHHCVSCDVGLHSTCYESYEIKPLHKVEPDMYVCIPCMTLATQINQEEVEEVAEVLATKDLGVDDVESHASSVMTLSSDEDDTFSRSIRSSSSSDNEQYDDIHTNDIPNVLKWNKDQVMDYFKEHLPQEIIDHLVNFNIDGRALQLLHRNDIVSNMGMKLGHALKFFKLVRILQTQSTFNRLFWE